MTKPKIMRFVYAVLKSLCFSFYELMRRTEGDSIIESATCPSARARRPASRLFMTAAGQCSGGLCQLRCGQMQDLRPEWGLDLDVQCRHQAADHAEVADQ